MVGLKPSEVPPTLMVKFFGAGTAACIADLIQGECLAEPSVRVAHYKGVMGTITTMVKMEGPASLYNGLVAGLQRQMTFASIRIGMYDSVKQFYCRQSENSGVACRLLAGSTTGALAVTCAQPTDVVKVRFQAHIKVIDGSKRYNGTMDAYKTIAKEEGLRGLWKDNLPCHFVAAFGAGFCTTVVASPVDVVKTRYMNSTAGQYKNAINCAFTMVIHASFPQTRLLEHRHVWTMPNITRNAIVNCAELVTYDLIKEAILNNQLMTEGVLWVV
ncbi:hypothetical protein AB205_0002150 [Aquarana catesbeiana]|uniref:Mitochondrial uncoupling protein 3 n=1 Tax=Aquarana catesbeiana TaxID=8400 RepID=A0A2G9R7W5_AQUCT|nr:hypothetical protein AB205_0002150 [Aquarana catesbeiana]